MIAQAWPDRKGADAEGIAQPSIALAVAPIDKIARRQQEIGHGVHAGQDTQDLIQSLPIEFRRIIRVKPQMDIRDLRDQHSTALPAQPPPHRARNAPTRSSPNEWLSITPQRQRTCSIATWFEDAFLRPDR